MGVPTKLAIVYYYGALHDAYTTTRVVLFCLAITFWILYFHEILFRSGRIRTQWLKKRLADLVLMLTVALTALLFFILLSGMSFHHHSR